MSRAKWPWIVKVCPWLESVGSRFVRTLPANSDVATRMQVVLLCSFIPKVLAQLHDNTTGVI